MCLCVLVCIFNLRLICVSWVGLFVQYRDISDEFSARYFIAVINVSKIFFHDKGKIVEPKRYFGINFGEFCSRCLDVWIINVFIKIDEHEFVCVAVTSIGISMQTVS